MSDVYTDYHFKFAAADCAVIAPAIGGRLNMLGDPYDADGQPFVPPGEPLEGETVEHREPAFFAARVGDEFFISFRSVAGFNAIAGLTEITADEAAAILGVWA